MTCNTCPYNLPLGENHIACEVCPHWLERRSIEEQIAFMWECRQDRERKWYSRLIIEEWLEGANHGA